MRYDLATIAKVLDMAMPCNWARCRDSSDGILKNGLSHGQGEF